MTTDYSGYGKISSIEYYIISSEENKRKSCTTILDKGLSKDGQDHGVYNTRMGTTDSAIKCGTCLNPKKYCPGHFGDLECVYPVQNPIFKDSIPKWLKVICFSCGKLVTDKLNSTFDNKDRHMTNIFSKAQISVDRCPHCKEYKPKVEFSKLEPVKILITYPPEEKNNIFLNKCRVIESDSGFAKKTRRKYFTEENELRRQLFNFEVAEIFQRVSEETMHQLGKTMKSHPSRLILYTPNVPPNIIRPDIKRIGGNRSNNSDTTALLKILADTNPSLPPITSNIISVDAQAKYNSFDHTYYEMIKGSSVNSKVKMVTNMNKTPTAIARLIPQKKGIFRKRVMGTRTHYMIRGVITGDKSLLIDEIGIPQRIAHFIQTQEQVQECNYKRMLIYFNNKRDKYPGCTQVIKKSTGNTHNVERVTSLEIGDILYRDLVDGDPVVFNRQPSLRYCSMTTHCAKVLPYGDTIRMNSSACNVYNADFDGDMMNVNIPHATEVKNEIMNVSGFNQFFISYQNSKPMVGLFQDGLIGIMMMSKDQVVAGKYQAMRLFANNRVISSNKYDKSKMKFHKDKYTMRELISRTLPDINLKNKKTSYYNPVYAPFIPYRDDEVTVNIVHGEFLEGTLDKKTVGQSAEGGLFHVMFIENGIDITLKTIFNLHQITMFYFLYRGFTLGIKDIIMNRERIKEVKMKTAQIIKSAKKITEELDAGKLIPPLGTTLAEYHEQLQQAKLESGDDFLAIIMSDTNKDNNLFNMIASGTKGNADNLNSIKGVIGGFDINGKRAEKSLIGRTCIYATRYDNDPVYKGYCETSFKEGIPPKVFLFAAQEARFQLTSGALSTSITGRMGRESVKNLESNIVNNMRSTCKNNKIIQIIANENGMDTRHVEKVKFPTIKLSGYEFQKFKCNVKEFDKKFNNSSTIKYTEDEFTQLLQDRMQFRNIFLKIESKNRKGYLFTDTMNMPVNVHRIILDVININKNKTDTSAKHSPSKKTKGGTKEKKRHTSNLTPYSHTKKKTYVLNPVYAYERVKDICDNLEYVFYNKGYLKKRGHIPTHVKNSFWLIKILIRSHLCLRKCLEYGLYDELIDLCIDKILYKLKQSFVAYGLAQGVITAQSISETLTQFILDSKHRAGNTGTKTNKVDRLKEIYTCKQTVEMANPSMLLSVLPEYENNKPIVREIANNIEMMPFSRFIAEGQYQVFIEQFGNPLHPDYKHEKKHIDMFLRYNKQSVPSNLSNICIRFPISRDELILKSMRMETIIIKLQLMFPKLFFVYTPENHTELIIRIYIRNDYFKKGFVDEYESYIEDLISSLLLTVIRGVDGIKHTTIVESNKSYEDSDGSIKSKKIFMIMTDGSNLYELLTNKHISYAYTDSIKEVEDIYGVEAARRRTIEELASVTNNVISMQHYVLYADEMSYSGTISSIQQSGLKQREPNNILLKASYSEPIQNFKNACLNNINNPLYGLSAPVSVGRAPNVGTTYNQTVINTEFISRYTKQFDDILDDL